MKLIPYATQWLDEEDIHAVEAALRLPLLTQGPLVKEFEDNVASYCGVKYAVAMNSGTSALHAACFAAGVSKGDEVITSPITFVASSNSVLYCQGRPVFADIQADTVNIDPQQIKKSISNKTKAIIPVHFAGHPCEMEEISAIAKEKGLIVIEDAAHALGARSRVQESRAGQEWTKVGSCTYSDMTCLSFHAVKHITTGEGGMVTTNDEELYKKLVMFRTHGITRDAALMTRPDEGPWYYEMHELGFNYRITDFQCALGISQLKKIDAFVSRRQEIVKRYNKAFSPLEGVIVPVEKEGCYSAWHIYVLRVKENRRKVFDHSRENDLGVNVHYYPVYMQPYYQKLGYKAGLCPKAEEYYSQAITLPLYPKMEDGDIERVIDTVKKVEKGG